MKATQKLHNFGQSLWLDGISRGLLNNGTLKQFIEELSVTGLTSNPIAIEQAIENSTVYDDAIRKKLKEDRVGENLLVELVLEDIRHAADLFRPIYDQTDGVDGWVSLDVSPLNTREAASTLSAIKELHALVRRPNVLIKLPGNRANLTTIEEAISIGVPVNVTQLFSREHYLAAAEAFLNGIERRIMAGLKPNISSVASFYVSNWDTAVEDKVPDTLRNQLGIAIALRTYKAWRELLHSPRWERAYNAGARPQRLLWTRLGTNDSKTSEAIYVGALIAPLTAVSLSEMGLQSFSDHLDVGDLLPVDGGNCEAVLARFSQSGIDIDSLAEELQTEEAASFVKSWIQAMTAIASKSAALTQAQQ